MIYGGYPPRPAEMDKIRISDVRLSRELFQLRLMEASDGGDTVLPFLKGITAERINIEFLSRVVINRETRTSCCIESESYDRVKGLLDSEPFLKDHAEFTSSVGLVSLFPHQFSLEILGRSLSAFVKMRFPIYGVASSISSLTFVTDYNRLKEVAEILRGSPFSSS